MLEKQARVSENLKTHEKVQPPSFRCASKAHNAEVKETLTDKVVQQSKGPTVWFLGHIQ